MTTRISLAALLAVMAGAAFAQEPSASPPATENTPTQSEPMTPSTPPASPPAATEPTPAAPAPVDKEAAAPSPTPSADVASSALKESEDDNKMVAPLSASVDAAEDMDIYDANGKKIAEVDAVLENANGEVKGVAIEYGGFLGFGDKGAILTLDQLKTQDGKLITEVTEEQLPTLPAWNQ